MSALLDIILPVFLIIGFGYAARKTNLILDSGVDGMMRFAQNFAIPCLLFRNMATLDIAANFEPGIFAAFYSGAFFCFIASGLLAFYAFKRAPEDSVAIGFCCLFSNSLLLGLPIMERAYGSAALAGNFTIIALHSPILYTAGIAAMEVVRARGTGLSPTALTTKIAKQIVRQPLVIGILLGLAWNLSGLPLFAVADGALQLMARAALPVALFGLGGILCQYRFGGDMRVIGMICALSLIVHPLITFTLGKAVGLNVDQLRSAVVTASMAPGVNAYLFANAYGVAKRVSASSVLLATALSILSIVVWLHILP
ncbi:AEC family transporter [Falsirhodobacter halotolerans]|uniref:AEC family transporter n=1 Tax=Falsirhodobacter halotolerans TaxID=1146892 RepID=UPI001FD5AAF0|nr:AEC family transporter [Falsirhodobacter halotolerans]MCJ8139932.1 AEC family transporter [Falsirhodobacter halotolerans]